MTTTSISTQKHCHQCDKMQDQVKTGSLKFCGRCRTVYYCSRECQEKDWPIHKLGCKKVNEIGKDSNITKEKRQKNLFQKISSFEKTASHSQIDENYIIEIAGEKLINYLPIFKKLNNSYQTKIDAMESVGFINQEASKCPHPFFYALMHCIFNKSIIEKKNIEENLIEHGKNIVDLFANTVMLFEIMKALMKADIECLENINKDELFNNRIKSSEIEDFQIQQLPPHYNVQSMVKGLIKESVKIISPNLGNCISPKWVLFDSYFKFPSIFNESSQFDNCEFENPPKEFFEAKCKSPEECLKIRKKALEDLKNLFT